MCIMHSKPWLSKWLWVCIIYSCYCCYCFLLDGLYSMFQNLFVVLCLQSSMFPKIWVFMFSSTWAYCPEMIGMPPWTGGAALELWGHAHGFQACCWTSVCRDSEQAHQKNDRRKCDCNDCIPLCHKTDLFDTWEWVCAKQFLVSQLKGSGEQMQCISQGALGKNTCNKATTQHLWGCIDKYSLCIVFLLLENAHLEFELCAYSTCV